MTKLFSALVALFLCLPAYATPVTPKTPATPNVRTGEPTVLSRACKTVRVIDGDTLVCGKTRVRALDYDTAEVRGKMKCPVLAAKATARFRELVSPPNRFGLKWAKGKDEFGRGLATFYSNARPIAPILIQEGLARPYSPAKGRQGWC